MILWRGIFGWRIQVWGLYCDATFPYLSFVLVWGSRSKNIVQMVAIWCVLRCASWLGIEELEIARDSKSVIHWAEDRSFKVTSLYSIGCRKLNPSWNPSIAFSSPILITIRFRWQISSWSKMSLRSLVSFAIIFWSMARSTALRGVQFLGEALDLWFFWFCCFSFLHLLQVLFGIRPHIFFRCLLAW